MEGQQRFSLDWQAILFSLGVSRGEISLLLWIERLEVHGRS
jgi:hypothetical protein